MPKALSPDKQHRVILECDKDQDPAPTFIYPFLTGRQQTQMMELYDSIQDSNSPLQNIKKSFGLASLFLIGWENITTPGGEAIPFDTARLDEVCSVLEVMELSQKVMFGQTLDVLDKKKSESLLDSDTAESVNPAQV